MRFGTLFTLLLCHCNPSVAQVSENFLELPVFVNGQDGYGCYRIPAVVKAPNGHLLAFAEGRVKDCDDFGDVDIVLKISQDNGQSWGPLQVAAQNDALQAGNPAPVVDLLDPAFPNGRIFLVYNTGDRSEWDVRAGQGERRVWYVASADNGMHWDKPIDITPMVRKPGWRTFANTPGHAIQLRAVPHRGRLFIPANHSANGPLTNFLDYRAHAFFSDDHGKTWQSGADVDVPGSNESIAVELPDGKILQSIRQQSGLQKERLIALSSDGGQSWASVYYHSQLPDPVCQAGLIDYTTSSGQQVLLFSNPESPRKREKMTIKVSFDQGKTWPVAKRVRSGPSAYSDLVIQADNRIGLLYEQGNNGGIYYARFTFDWLNDGRQIPYGAVAPGMPAPAGLVELAPPVLEMDSVWFRTDGRIRLKLGLENVQLRYTLDGNDPDPTSPLYEGPVKVRENGRIKAKAFSDCCKPSKTVQLDFFRIGPAWSVKNAILAEQPNKKYPGGGWKSLVDQTKGSTDFRDGNWIGFEGSDAQLTLELTQKQTASSLIISCLSDPGAWIFPPGAVEVFGSKNGKDFRPVARQTVEWTQSDLPSGMHYLSVDFLPVKYKFWRITVKNYGKLPGWHPGAGNSAWLFLDEILFN